MIKKTHAIANSSWLKIEQLLSCLGTWDAQTERPCLSTRGPRKPVLIWPSMATAAAIGRIADAQRARAETCTRTRPRSCTKRPSGGIAMTPTNHPERRLRAVYMCERGAVRARAPVISEKSWAEKPSWRRSEGARVELRSSWLRCPVWPSEWPRVAIWGLRRPARPWPRPFPNRPCL